MLSISSTTSDIALCFRACGKNWLPATTFLPIRLGRQDWIPTKITRSSGNGPLGAKCVTIKYFVVARVYFACVHVCVCVGGGGGERWGEGVDFFMPGPLPVLGLSVPNIEKIIKQNK